MELPYDPAIPMLVMSPKALQAETQTPVLECSQQHYPQQSKGENNPNVH